MLPLEASFFCFSFDFLISLSFFGRDVFFGERRGIFAVLRPVKTVGLVGCRRDGVDVLARSVHGHTVLFFKSFQVSVVTTLSKVLTVSASDCEISSSRSFLYTMHHHLRHRNWAFHDLWLGTSTVLSTICVKICGTRMAISSTCGLAAGTTSSSCCSPFVAFSVSRVFPAIRLSTVVHLSCASLGDSSVACSARGLTVRPLSPHHHALYSRAPSRPAVSTTACRVTNLLAALTESGTPSLVSSATCRCSLRHVHRDSTSMAPIPCASV